MAGIFESGFYDIDDNWAFASLTIGAGSLFAGGRGQRHRNQAGRYVSRREVARQAEKIAGPEYAATTWQEQNKQLLNALKSERVVTWITIGLIEMVAALNIFITLVMMVMEKYKDIAVLMSMGARRAQIRSIFMLQGVLIGVAGTAIGLMAGYTLCYFADQYRGSRWMKPCTR